MTDYNEDIYYIITGPQAKDADIIQFLALWLSYWMEQNQNEYIYLYGMAA